MRIGTILATLIGGLLGLLTAWLLVEGYEVAAMLLDSLLMALTPNRFER